MLGQALTFQENMTTVKPSIIQKVADSGILICTNLMEILTFRTTTTYLRYVAFISVSYESTFINLFCPRFFSFYPYYINELSCLCIDNKSSIFKRSLKSCFFSVFKVISKEIKQFILFIISLILFLISTGSQRIS